MVDVSNCGSFNFVCHGNSNCISRGTMILFVGVVVVGAILAILTSDNCSWRGGLISSGSEPESDSEEESEEDIFNKCSSFSVFEIQRTFFRGGKKSYSPCFSSFSY